jgi:hypothetical protein
MKKTINIYDFRQEFINYDRQNYFSYEGQKALFEYLEDFEDSTGTEYELNVVDLCYEYTEYKDQAEFWKDYDEEKYQTIEDIEERTYVISVGEEGFIIRDF